jgi:hypothetical protein
VTLVGGMSGGDTVAVDVGNSSAGDPAGDGDTPG